MIYLQKVTEDIIKQGNYLLYIHSKFCGTCHVARSMLEQIERIYDKDIFYEMNAAYHEEYLQAQKVESVPCLLICKNNETVEKIYAFQSVSNVFKQSAYYHPNLFTSV